MHLPAHRRACFVFREVIDNVGYLLGDASYYQQHRDQYPNHFANRPGAYIESLKPEIRAHLKHLRSEDLANDHPPPTDPYVIYCKDGGTIEFRPPTVIRPPSKVFNGP